MFGFNIDKKIMKKLVFIVTYAILLCFVLFNFEGAKTTLGFVIHIVNPLIYGFCIAFILNIFMNKIEKKLVDSGKSKKNAKTKNYRKQSIIISVLILFGIIILTFVLIIPQLINTGKIFIENFPYAYATVKNWTMDILSSYPEISEKVQNYNPDWNQLLEQTANALKNNSSGIIGGSMKFINSFFTVIVNLCMGFVIGIYMLLKKEKLIAEIQKVTKMHTTEKRYANILKVGRLSNIKFQKYFEGQFTEALIIGIITFVAMLIFRIPYAGSIAVLLGVMSLIPMFGTIIGTIIGAILIVAVNPIKALWFIILVIVIQQIEDNLIKPKVVGKNLAIPESLTFIALLLAGTNFGILGLILALPIAAILYDLYKEYVNKKQEQE